MYGKKIRNARKAKGLSILQLREKTGLSKSTISELENDISNPNIGTLQKIADALEIPVEVLIGGNNEVIDATVNELYNTVEAYDLPVVKGGETKYEKRELSDSEKKNLAKDILIDIPEIFYDLPKEAQKDLIEYATYLKQKYNKE